MSNNNNNDKDNHDDDGKQQRWVSLADRLNPNRPGMFDPVFKEEWEKMSREERTEIIWADKRDIKALKRRGLEAQKTLPFEADPKDHCETSPTAYQHVAPILRLVAKLLKKKAPDLKIYDPYYCAGAVTTHLNALGFDHVYNKPEDFYKVIAEGRVPDYDIVVTNPPYSSGDEKQTLPLAPSRLFFR
jgi:hypothetical protein